MNSSKGMSFKGKELEDFTYEEKIYKSGNKQKLVFNKNMFRQIEQIDFTIESSKVFKYKIIRDKIHKHPHEYYIIQQKETPIPIHQVKGKIRMSLVTKEFIQTEIRKINSEVSLQYLYFGAIEIVIKACFPHGIDTPLELYIADDRIIEPIEKSIIAQLEGNLIYQKVIFRIAPNYAISLSDKNIDKSLVIY